MVDCRHMVAVSVLLVVASAFIGAAMMSEDSDAAVNFGSASSPLNSFNDSYEAFYDHGTLQNNAYHLYVKVGGSVTITSVNEEAWFMGPESVTSGFGLTFRQTDTYLSHAIGTVSGTVSKAGDCTIAIYEDDDGTISRPSIIVHSVGSGYSFTFAYDANGGDSSPANQTFSASIKEPTFTISDQVPTKSGHTFTGWRWEVTSGDFEGEWGIAQPGESFAFVDGMPTTINFVAQWVADAVNLTAIQGTTTSFTLLNSVDPNAEIVVGSCDEFASLAKGGMTIALNSGVVMLKVTKSTPAGVYHIHWYTRSVQNTAALDRGDIALTVLASEVQMELEPVAKQYCVAGSTVSFGVVSNAGTAGKTVTCTVDDVPSGLSVNVNGSTVTCSSSTVGTYTFTLTASASGYTASSTTVTVQFVPLLAFSNTPSAGALNA